MPHQFDASTKFLIQERLADWLPLCGRSTSARVEIIDADLATVTAAADRVLRVREDPPWLLHLELQAGRDAGLAARLLMYNALLENRHEVVVRTLVVLLRPAADTVDLNGVWQRSFPGEQPYLTFHYGVVRVWQQPVDRLLAGGLGILPLAPISAVVETQLPAIIERMQERIGREASPEEAGTLWTATDVLMGLRYPRTLINQLMRGVHGMKESVTYQAIVEEGVVKARQEVLLRLGRRRFGNPAESIEHALRGITDPERLERLIDQLLDTTGWDELLAVP